MPKAEHTVLEIDLSALHHNYKFLKSKLDAGTKFLAVVKAFTYGNHSVEAVRALESWGVDYFAVAYVPEGEALKKAGITAPIMVFHPQPVNFERAIAVELEPTLYSPRTLRQFLEVAKDQSQYPVHLKFNTGLNRVGFWENDVDFIFKTIGDSRILDIRSVFSHLAASDDLDEKDFTRQQIESFESTYETVQAHLGYRPIKHILNTSGILNNPEAQFDMVRTGIGLHGYGNDPNYDKALKPLVTLKTVISQMHKIETGETVGYNRAYAAAGSRVTATLPLGHADGIGRHFGKQKGHVHVKGKTAPIIGNVCMDMMMIDVSGIDCKEGDEVIVFGGRHSAEQFAKNGHTISYELLTGISPRVERIVHPAS